MPFAEPAAVDDQDADPETVARSICLRQLDRSPRTRGQLADALRKRRVPDEVAERVLTRLEEVGLVDDAAFATAWVESRHGTRGLSSQALGRELRSRGVADDTVAEAVGALDHDTQLRTARELAIRKQRSMATLDRTVQQRRLVAMLGRKGYPAGLVYSVVREVVREAGDDSLDDARDDTGGVVDDVESRRASAVGVWPARDAARAVGGPGNSCDASD